MSEVQAAASEWAGLRAEEVRVAEEWNFGKPFLADALAARQAKLKELESKLASADASARKNAEEQADASSRIGAAQAYLEAAGKLLAETEAALVAIRPKMPPRLSDALNLSFLTLEDNGKSLTERWQAATLILNRCAQFDHSIVKSEELLQVDASKPRLVETIYWGLSQGYALDRAANLAWRASPGKTAWTWETCDEPSRISHMLSIYDEHSDPVFVLIDAKLNNPSTGKVQ